MESGNVTQKNNRNSTVVSKKFFKLNQLQKEMRKVITPEIIL